MYPPATSSPMRLRGTTTSESGWSRRTISNRRSARLGSPALLLCQGGARFECVEDDADEQSFQAAECFAAALPLGAFALEVVACGRVVAGLGDRDPVERSVELPVAAAVKPVALCAA
jgi:hypothetical protein